MIYKIVRLFVNNLTADDKHYLLDKDNLRQPIQMQLSEEQKSFSELSFYIIKISVKFYIFDKQR